MKGREVTVWSCNVRKLGITFFLGLLSAGEEVQPGLPRGVWCIRGWITLDNKLSSLGVLISFGSPQSLYGTPYGYSCWEQGVSSQGYDLFRCYKE